MKKFLFWALMAILVVLVRYQAAQAQTWYPANQKTVAWDAVTKLDDGTALPADSTVQYRIYVVAASNTTKSNPTEVTVVTQPTVLITFTAEGKYFVGVKAERMVAGAKVSESTITWSDSASGTQGGTTFGVTFYKGLTAPGGLR